MLTAGALLSSSRATAKSSATERPLSRQPATPGCGLISLSRLHSPADGGSASASSSSSSTAPKMELTEFAAHVNSRFNINKIEP